MRSKKIWPALVLLAIAGGCGGQREKGSPNDPNEQQGNPNAKPEQSISSKPGSAPSDNKAGKDPHSQVPEGATKQ